MDWFRCLVVGACCTACGPGVGGNDGNGDGGSETSNSSSSSSSAEVTSSIDTGSESSSTTGPPGELCPAGNTQGPSFFASLGFPTGTEDFDQMCTITEFDYRETEDSIEFTCADGEPGGAQWSNSAVALPPEIVVGTEIRVRGFFEEFGASFHIALAIHDTNGDLLVAGSSSNYPGDPIPSVAATEDYSPLVVEVGQTVCEQVQGECNPWVQPGSLFIATADGNEFQIFEHTTQMMGSYAAHTGRLVADAGGETTCDGGTDHGFDFLVGRTG